MWLFINSRNGESMALINKTSNRFCPVLHRSRLRVEEIPIWAQRNRNPTQSNKTR